ncbi:MAG: hypothetical protein D6694_07390 [Gammaproteobacteria bacterium]|nr:MAG: hypothetical protein D6694_07390 [Gammaproteobacteria bacterium]
MKTIAVDTESLGGGGFGALKKLYTVQIACADGADVYPVFCHTYADALGIGGLAARNATEVLDILSEAEHIVFANAAHDLSVLYSFYGDALAKAKFKWDDVLLMLWCMCPNRPYAAGEQHSLASWGERLGFPKDKMRFTWDRIHAALEDETAEVTTNTGIELLEYGKRDAELTFAIWEHLNKELLTLDPIVKNAAMSTYTLIERPTVMLVMEMQAHGMKLDLDHLAVLWDEWGELLDQSESSMKEWVRENIGFVPAATPKLLKKPMNGDAEKLDRYFFCGQDENGMYVYREKLELNPKSNDQLAWVFQQLGWKPIEFSDKTGKPLLSKGQLDELAPRYELAKQLKTFREFEKLFTTYVVGMHNTGTAQDGWIFPGWNQNGTITGRYSCSNPNFQNLPARTEHGQRIRQAVIAPPGMKLVGIDLQAIEYRVLADQMAQYFMQYHGHIPPDVDFMLQAFINGKDIHTEMAQLWFGHKPDYQDKAKYYRTIGKNVSYGRMFGFGAAKASTMMGVSEEDARAIIATANESNPSFNEFQQWVWQSAIDNGGWGFTAFNRPNYYPDICLKPSSRTHEAIARAKRQCFNARIQGTAADINKLIHLDVNTSELCATNVLDKLEGSEYKHLRNMMLVLNGSPIVPAFDGINVGTVHDELLFYVDDYNAEPLAAALTLHYRNNWSYMQFCPIDGTANYGDNWSVIK